MILARASGVLGLGALLLSARPAQAQSEPPKRAVALLGTCDAISMSEVASALRVELFNRYQEGAPASGADRASVTCIGDAVTVTVTAPDASTRALETSLARSPANVRARIVALAIAEIVRDVDEAPRALPPRPPRANRDETTPLPPRAPRRIELGAFGQGSTFRFNGEWLGGGGVRFAYAAPRAHVCAGLDAAALASDERFERGSAHVLLAYASPTVAWQPTSEGERWQLRLGAGYAAGAGRITGHASAAGVVAGSTTGAWTAPYAFAGVGLALTEAIRLEGRAQVGWVASPVVGDVTEVSGASADVALKGLWTTVQAGFAIAL